MGNAQAGMTAAQKDACFKDTVLQGPDWVGISDKDVAGLGIDLEELIRTHKTLLTDLFVHFFEPLEPVSETNSRDVISACARVLENYVTTIEFFKLRIWTTPDDRGVDEAVVLLGQTVSRSSRLHTFQLSCIQMGEIPRSILLNTLGQNQALRSLSLMDLDMGDVSLVQLAQMLESTLSEVRYLNLAGNRFEALGCAALGSVLVRSIHLQVLNVSRSVENDMDVIMASVAENNSLRKFHMDYTGGRMYDLLTMFNTNTALTVLDASEFTTEILPIHDGQVLAAFLRENTTLITLNLQGLVVSDVGCAHLGGAFVTNNTLCRIDLGDRGLTRNGMFSIAERLLDRDVPRCRPLLIYDSPSSTQLQLRHVGVDLGWPAESVEWDNARFLEELKAPWQAILLAFAMGMHPRLNQRQRKNQVEASLVYILHKDLVHSIGDAYWGRNLGPTNEVLRRWRLQTDTAYGPKNRWFE
jgi:hypothetical protein